MAPRSVIGKSGLVAIATITTLFAGACSRPATPQAAAQATMKAVNSDEEQTMTAVDQIDFTVEDSTAVSVTDARSVVDFYTAIGAMNTQPDVTATLLVVWSKEGS